MSVFLLALGLALVSGNCDFNGKSYDFCKDMTPDKLSLFWSLSTDYPNRTLTITAVFPQTAGWVGFGFNKVPKKMLGGSVVVGWMGNQTGEAHEYKLNDFFPSAVVIDNVLGLSEPPTYSVVAGKSIITFKKKANLAYPMTPNQAAHLIWASHKSKVPAPGSTTLDEHDSTGDAELVLDTGVAKSASTIHWDYVHGSLMSICFVFLLPTGVLIARYFKFYKPPLWFQLHQYIQYAGVATATVAFIIALKYLDSGYHKTHQFIGIITISLALFQPFNSFFRPHPPQPGQEPSSARKTWNMIHWWGGRLCVVGGILNVYIGLDIIKASHLLTIGLSIYLFALLCAALCFSYQNFDRLLRKRGSESQERVEVTKSGSGEKPQGDRERAHLLRSQLPSAQSDDES